LASVSPSWREIFKTPVNLPNFIDNIKYESKIKCNISIKVDYKTFYNFIKYHYGFIPNFEECNISLLSSLAENISCENLTSICKCVGNKEETMVLLSAADQILKHQLLLFVANGLYSDIQFILLDDKTIRAHRAILACRNEFFRAMFCDGMKESIEPTATINKKKLPLITVMEYM